VDDIRQPVCFQNSFESAIKVFEADAFGLLYDAASTSEYVFDEVLWALYAQNEVKKETINGLENCEYQFFFLTKELDR